MNAKKPNPTPAENSAPETPADEKPLTVTVRGQAYTITAEARDDFELLADLSELDRLQNAALMPSILRRLLGPVQMKAALDSLRDVETGRVTVEAGGTFVDELLGALDPN